MSAIELDALLDRMPQIAAAVNQFSSDSMQSEVFRALMGAYGVPQENNHEVADNPGEDDATKDRNTNDSRDTSSPAAKKTPAKKASTSKAKQSFSVDKDLDLVKGGNPSFKEFWESKSPTSNQEKCLICVYWLSRKTNQPKAVTIDQVYTCFKDAGWAVPNDLANTLAQTGTKGWLDSKKRDDLKVVVRGENHVELEMPAKAKAA